MCCFSGAHFAGTVLEEDVECLRMRTPSVRIQGSFKQRPDQSIDRQDRCQLAMLELLSVDTTSLDAMVMKG